MMHGIFYMPIHTGTTGHAKAFDYPAMDPLGEVKVASFQVCGGRKPTTCQSTVSHANHCTTKTPLVSMF